MLPLSVRTTSSVPFLFPCPSWTVRPADNRLLGQKKLTVLSIYPDEELDEWRKHLNEFPKEWINGYDKKFAIKEQQLYDLKAIPTLYLLNKEKTVLLKDATAQAIEEYLTNVELE